MMIQIFFLDVFAKVDQFTFSSLIIAGYFNAVLSPLDYQGGTQTHCNVKSCDTINVLIDEFNLVDI